MTLIPGPWVAWRAAQRGGRARALLATLAAPWIFFAATPQVASGEASSVWITDETPRRPSLAHLVDEPAVDWQTDALTDPAMFQVPVTPQVEAPATTPQTAPTQRAAQQFWTSFGGGQTPQFVAASVPSATSYVAGQEATIRASTDLGDLVGSSPAALDLGVQRRNPIVTDPRIHSSRVGSLAASGSYWVPARIDLDTMVSKIDSRLVEDVLVVPGPFAVLYGPGYDFMNFQLQRPERFPGGFEAHASTSVDYRTNGEQWYGRQSLWGGNESWAFRAGYGHRTGSDYISGDGNQIPSSYKSRDIDLAISGQISENETIDGQALRLDQTDVELAGQAFDIDWLVTDGYEVTYQVEQPLWADGIVFESWYNRTRFEGSAQRPSKRAQFPFYDVIAFTGFTDVDSMSTGYSLASRYDGSNAENLKLGADLRYVKQELNEITSGVDVFQWVDQNSPIPRSYSSNPGLFAAYDSGDAMEARFTAGARIDYVGMNVLEDAAELAAVGINSEIAPTSAADIWGTDDVNQHELLGLGYLALDADVADGWTAGAGLGYGERAPNLTERYAIETFMFLLQNGLNTITGDPSLDKERLLQVDLRTGVTGEDVRGEVRVFHAWVHDYITYEALSAVPGPPSGQIEQLNLKYVNTDLATLWGCEARADYLWRDGVTPFATVKYVQGEDHSRNGSFDTQPSTPGTPSIRVPGVRGAGSGTGVIAGDNEPLPSILPLESRIGLRWEERRNDPRWGVEIAARIVDNQNRVAASLLETPTPGFTVYDLRTFWRPTDGFQLVGGVENFTDKQFREHLDFRSQSGYTVFRPGVNFYVGSILTY